MNAARITLGFFVIAATAATAGAQANLDYATMWLRGDQAQAVAPAGDVPDAPARDIRVQVWHGKSEDAVYERGEELDVYFRANQDLYVVVYRLDAEGYVEVLWPTSRYDDGFVYGGHSYRLPPPSSARRLHVSTMKGVEYVEAIASEYPFDLRDLAIDFRFAEESGEPYYYAVDGDPFLAVNDINYAITGLEEDVPYIVTDFAHLYVDEKVEYARYSCRQCHVEDDYHHPYVNTCTEIVIRYDYGWYDSWYLRYGWYPVYYDPYYRLWDIRFGRPYYYWYYPVYYSWSPWYGIYDCGYPVYVYDPPRRHRPSRPPLYDRPDPRDRGDRWGRRDLVRGDDSLRDRIDLVDNRPSRLAERERPTLSERRSERGFLGRPTTGPDRAERLRPPSRTVNPPEGRLRAQRNSDARERSRIDREPREPRSTDNTRRWTRPVLRNRPDDRGRERDSTVRPPSERPRLRERDTNRDRQSIERRPPVQRQPNTKREIRRPDPPKERPRANSPRREAPKPKRSEPRKEIKRDSKGGDSKPAPRPSPPPRSRGGGSSKSRGNGSKSGSRGGGGN